MGGGGGEQRVVLKGAGGAVYLIRSRRGWCHSVFTQNVSLLSHHLPSPIDDAKLMLLPPSCIVWGGGQPYLNLFKPIPNLEAEGVIGLNRF